MSVRSKLFSAVNISSVLTKAPGGIHAGGSLTGAPVTRPFIVYRVQVEDPALRGDDGDEATRTTAEFWVYDDPGTYTRVEDVLATLKTVLASVTSLRCTWLGTSPELSDDQMKAIVKYATFQIGDLS